MDISALKEMPQKTYDLKAIHMKYLSICIPAHEMGGKGPEYLAYSFDVMLKQSFQDFEVIISDQSKNDGIEKVCGRYRGKLDITYVKEPTGARSQSINFNNGLKHCTGKLVKIMWLDDFFYYTDALKDIVDAFDLKKDHWLVTSCIQTKDCKDFFRLFHPTYNDATSLFKNSIGAPTVLTIKNENPLRFDEKITVWYTDIDYYKRYFDRFGPPKILDKITVAIRVHENSVTNTTATEKRRDKEWQYIVKKYKLPHPYRLILGYKYRRYTKQFKGMIKIMLGIKHS